MPKFIHDCESCVYLGARSLYGYGRYTDYDFYYCQRDKTLLARFGDDGPDYISRDAKHLNAAFPELTTAAIMALKQGLISTDDLENF